MVRSATIVPSRESGFTLLELLISISLLSVMLVMTYSVFQTAMSAVPRGEEVVDLSARLGMATSIMTRQVRSMVDYPAETDSEYHTFFVGEDSGFSFVTSAPQLGGGEGLSWVTYSSADGSSLSLTERKIFSTAQFSAEESQAPLGLSEFDSREEAAQTVLIAGLESVRFEYLRLDGMDDEWIDTWDALEEANPPGAVRVTVEGLGLAGDSYWVQEIPVMVVVYQLGNYDSDIGLFFDEPTDVFGEDFGDDEGDDGDE